MTTRHSLVGPTWPAHGQKRHWRPTSGWRRTGSAFLGPITWTRRGAERLRRRLPEDGQDGGCGAACEQAWAGFERVLGPRHPDTLRSRARLAQVYSRLGRYGDARALLRDTVDRLERTLPDGDPLITELRQSLADIGEE